MREGYYALPSRQYDALWTNVVVTQFQDLQKLLPLHQKLINLMTVSSTSHLQSQDSFALSFRNAFAELPLYTLYRPTFLHQGTSALLTCRRGHPARC